MKKIISLILIVCMLVTSACFAVSAANEDSLEKQKLKYLIDLVDGYYSIWGEPVTFTPLMKSYSDAKTALADENSTDYDYYYARKNLFDDHLNMYVVEGFAEETYKKAREEKNYNNWYTDEQWANFQSKLDDLGKALETHDSYYSKDLTVAYMAMMKAYNEMTNAYTLKGDLDRSGEVDVKDATLLMKYLARLEDLTGAQKMLSGSAKYEDLTITDATRIQKYIARLIDEMPNNSVFIEDKEEYAASAGAIDPGIIMERTANFNICPRVYPQIYISNDFTDFWVSYQYMYWCDQNGYEL